MAVKFKNTININDQYTFPTVVGTDGQYLSITDAAAGTLDWTNIGDVDGFKSNFVYYDAKNSTGSTIDAGTAVMAVGSDGNSGHILIAPMNADGSVEPKYFIGVVDDDISNGQIGNVVHFGTIDQINTNAFSDGDVLWCDPANPGGFTTTEPQAPSPKLAAAIVLNSSTNGKLLVRVQGNEGLHELHDVKLDNVSNGQALVWDEVGGYWKNINASELVQAALTIEKNSFVGDGVEVDFVIDSAVIAESRTQVYIDGVYQSKENYSTSSQTVTFSEAPADGANIEIIHITTLSADISIDTFIGDGATSVYELSKAISGENNTQVYFDGVYQSKDNYTVSGSNITFSENVASGVDIEVVHLQPSVSQSVAFSGQVILYGGIADAYGGSGENGQILSSSPLGVEWIDAPDLDGEIANRIAADNTLQDNIDAEGTARIAADTVLQNNIDAEATTRASEDATLLSTINAEAVIRGTNDNTLQSNIDSEETARISADNTLQDNINIEAQSRASADAALQSSIDTINAKDIVLTINGDASGSTTFTNLTNATLTLAIVDDSHNHVISNIDGLQSALDLKANITYVDSAVANLVDSSPSALNTLNELAAALGDDPNFATTVSTQIGTAQSTADTALTNANAALAKDPTLTLSGDASGSATFTNLGNATLSVTIADDSHNHIISNIDGLQTALNGKQAAGTYNTIIGTDTDIDTSGATIVDNIYVTDGVITSMGTRTLTLGDLGYTGATNANYITNNNQLTNGAGYLTTSGKAADSNLLDGLDSTSFFRNGDTTLQMSNDDGFVYNDSTNVMYVRRDGSDSILWHSSNDGSGSGLDADLLDGRQPSTTGGANNIAQYASNGYLYVNNWIHPADNTGLFWDNGVHVKASTSGELELSDAGQNVRLAINGDVNLWKYVSLRTGTTTKWDIATNETDRAGALQFRLNGTSSGAYIDTSSNMFSTGSLRAPIFYDSDNTSYYLDPTTSGTSAVLRGNILIEKGNSTGTAIEINSVRDSTWPFEFTSNDVGNDNPSGFWVGVDGYPDMRLRREGSTVNALISSWQRSFTTHGFTDSTDMRAPIFYDSLSTGYYLDPGSTSRLNVTTINQVNIAAEAAYALRFWNGSDNYSIRMSASAHGTYGGRVAGETTSDYNMYFTMASGTNRGFVFNNGLANPIAGIDASGNGRFEGDVIAFSASDERLKDNIKPIENALDKVNKISGVEFDWNSNQDTYADGMHDIGVIAQEIEEVIPEVVKTRDNGYKAVKYEKIVPLLIEAIKEQQTQIDELKKLINKQ